MATITRRGTPTQTNGELPARGSEPPGFRLVDGDLKDVTLHDYAGKRKVLNIFPSIDTPTCAMSVRKFNQKAAGLSNTVVLCISADLPFAQKRFCSAEKIGAIKVLSDTVDREYGLKYGLLMKGRSLLARAVIVVGKDGKVAYQEIVSEQAHEPDYDKALAAAKTAAAAP